MKLSRLRLENFRQFHGTQELTFAQGETDNVTVIHGDNGAGKTTLLNAFTWLFYDEVNLPRPEKIVTERALSEASVNGRVTTSVSLEFDHEDAVYTAERSQVYEKRSEDDLSGSQIDEELTLEYIDEDGNHEQRGNPKSALKQILPQRLREIFFFDGETISELTAEDGQEQIRSAIRNIMGLEILERAIRHLDAVGKEFDKLAQEHGSTELQDLISRKAGIEEDISACEAKLDDRISSRKESKGELEEIDQRLANREESRELQVERQRLQEELDTVADDIDDINDRLGTDLSDHGQLPFAMPAIEETARMLQDKRRKREIPSDIKTHFVEDLLELEECICGRPLGHDTDAREEVSSWRSRAGSSELEEAAMKIVGRLSEMGQQQISLYDGIDGKLADRAEKRERKRQLREQLDDIGDSLSDIETEDIAGLESRRETLQEDIEGYTEDIGALEAERDRLMDELAEVKRDKAEAEEEDETADRARRRAQTAEYLGEQVEALFERYQNRVRESVNDRVNSTFRSIIEKQYYAQISADYDLRILKDVGDTQNEDVAKSTGERQVASLSFIASLVSLAKDRYESEEDATYFSGGIYPMLMDSPFGYLDPTYQERVSQTLPDMGEQVIVLVTESQWSEAVAGEMAKIAGQQYELDYQAERDYDATDIVAVEGSA